jgi:hypothetical protein
MLIFYSPVQLQGLHVNHWTAHNKTGFYGRSAAKLRHRGKMQNSTGGPQNGGDGDKTCREQKSAPAALLHLLCFAVSRTQVLWRRGGDSKNAERDYAKLFPLVENSFLADARKHFSKSLKKPH